MIKSLKLFLEELKPLPNLNFGWSPFSVVSLCLCSTSFLSWIDGWKWRCWEQTIKISETYSNNLHFLLELYCTKSKARKQTNKNSNPAPEKFDLTHQESYRHHNQTLTCTDTVICSFTINSPNLVNRYDVKVSHLWRARSLSSLLTRITSLFELHIFQTQLKSYLVRCVFSCNCWLPYTESGGFFKLAILLLWLLPKVFAVNASFIFIFFLLLATSHHPTDGQKLCPG